MLTDVLGIAVAFATVMLVLSLLVTSLAQVIQHFLRMRNRRLRDGLTRLMNVALNDVKSTAPPGGDADAKSGARALPSATDLVTAALASGSIEPKHGWFQQGCTWLNKKDLVHAVGRLGIGDDFTQEVERRYSQFAAHVKATLAAQMRVISVALAFLVAFSFQVSTPGLLDKLSSNPELVQQIEALEGRVTAQAEAVQRREAAYEAIAEDALVRLRERHPGLAELDEVGGLGESKHAILEELDMALDGNAEREAVLENYESILDELHREGFDEAVDSVKEQGATLQAMDITFWSGGMEFYTGEGGAGNLLGVLVTSLFLMLGAPFWYNTLKNFSNLRDVARSVVSKEDEDKDDKK